MVSILFSKRLFGFLSSMVLLAACKKDGNPNNLPDVSPGDYEGTVDGFRSSEEIFPDDLVAYWSFDNTKNELKTNTAPTQSANDAFIPNGVKGQAIRFNQGYLYFAQQLPQFKTDALKNFTISMWVQVLNNGSKKTQIFQLARPTKLNGNIDFILETNINPASNTDYVRVHPYFTTAGDTREDNVNAFGTQNLSPKFGDAKWTHLVITYEASSGLFNLWGDGVKIGNYPSRGTAANKLFQAWEPNEVIIGGNYNVIPGKEVSTDASFAAMTGAVDEIRVYDRSLPDAYIRALYNLGLANL